MLPLAQLFVTALKKQTKGTNTHLTSKQTVLELQMISSSIITALDGLEERGMIEKEDEKYQLINPVVRFYALKAD